MAFYVNSSAIGADLNNTNTTQLFALGSTTEGSDGTLWQYVNAATSVTQYAVVAISTSGTMGMCSVADALAGSQLAVTQNAFAASDYGWVPIRGTGGDNNQFKVLASATISVANALYISSQTGKLSMATSGSSTIRGITLYGASGSDTTAVTAYACIITWPKCSYSGL